MQIIKLQLDDLRYAGLRPVEDSLVVTDSIFCIADGITRDPNIKKDWSGFDIKTALKSYPNPSPAKIAADLFTKTFIEKVDSNKDVKDAFIEGNKKINDLNKEKNPTPDYLINDYWACLACGGHICDSKLSYGYIGDCGIRVIDNKGKIKYKTRDSLKVFENYFYNINPVKNFDWKKPEYRVMVRKEFRNNINKKYGGEIVSYGALTGEKSAEKFIETGEVNLEKDYLVIFYSDGFDDLLNESEFYPVLLESLSKNSTEPIKTLSNKFARQEAIKYGRERSLIVVKI
jgi:serine/threonine protein phosphatase PrpC